MAAASGIVASGHAATSAAGAEILGEGGNAFDAALAALCAACVCEPLLVSLGGGGFLMAQSADGDPVVYDFFAQTPKQRRPLDEVDFYPIVADFGTATQEFHIGMGSMAVPGVVAGLFEVHRRHCRLEMERIVAPAIRLAREGVKVNRLQNYISHILLPILEASPAAMRLVATAGAPDRIAADGEWVTNPDLAATLELLAREGPDPFYRGELAKRLAQDCRQRGGLLTAEDLSEYRVHVRPAIRYAGHGAQFALNAPPSPSGSLVAFALAMLEEFEFGAHRWGSPGHCTAVVSAMQAASELRREAGLHRGLDEETASELLHPDRLSQWRRQTMSAPLFSRGTTHLSVADSGGNFASLTASNGEGCAYVLPGTGIMMNNMLGEEDLNPGGFNRWPTDTRLASMMCPTVATLPDGGVVALGSGGSNRIRSAIVQVLVNLFAYRMSLAEAVAAPRMHLEGNHLSVEAGYPEATLQALERQWPEFRLWPEPNLFFGGVHAVERHADGRFHGAGDRRRGGVAVLAE